MVDRLVAALVVGTVLIPVSGPVSWAGDEGKPAGGVPEPLASAFRPPPEFAGDLGADKSPLVSVGWEPGRTRKRGVITAESPRTGAYQWLVEGGHDLHALMAPRPFLVSGGSEDPPVRWRALNYAVAVNTLLGFEGRVAMTNWPGHSPTEESNEQVYRVLEHVLEPRR